jgi:hypothetical protein
MMKRESKGWKQIGRKTIPGVLGARPDGKRTGYGEHSFRRFRITYLQTEGVPEIYIKYWAGHGKKDITEKYSNIKQMAAKRREPCQSAGLGFVLPATKMKSRQPERRQKAMQREQRPFRGQRRENSERARL